MLQNRQYQDIEELADKIKDPHSMGQNKSVDSLSPEFSNRVKAFLASPEAREKGITIREARRSPLTQLAYFTKGRAYDEGFIHRMFKKAGFSGGAWSPRVQNTQTLGSEHFAGDAVDFEDHGKGEAYYREIAPIAKKYGLEWGGDWPGWKDYPHFQLPKNDNAIGYKGPPNQAENASDEEMQRADGEGYRYYNNKASITTKERLSSTQGTIRTPDYMGTTTNTALHLKESPVITSDKILINQINNAINIQNAIYSEQKRHNNVSENFFNSLIVLLQEMNKTGLNQSGTSNAKLNMSDIHMANTIMEADKIAKEYFVKNARRMAIGV
jgi:peptidoglycan L-alanyl-D-glutamate endopeptidase CwlK